METAVAVLAEPILTLGGCIVERSRCTYLTTNVPDVHVEMRVLGNIIDEYDQIASPVLSVPQATWMVK